MCTLCYPLHCPPLSCALCTPSCYCSDLHKHRLMHYFMNYKCCDVLYMYCPSEQCLLFFSLLCVLPFAVALFCILSAILCVTVRYAMPGVQRFPIRRQNTPLSSQDTPKTQPEVKLDCWWLIFAHGPEGPARWERWGCYWQTVSPQWGGRRFFDASAKFFFTKTAITRERKVEKLSPRWEMKRLS